MTVRFIFCFGLYLISTLSVAAKSNDPDSLRVATAFTELLTICRSVDFSDPKTAEVGMFYKAAPYIVYRGEDEARKWKDVANYTNPAEKNAVDDICTRINNMLGNEMNYKMVQFHKESESEGTWHVLMVSYIKKGTEKKAAFAFLKIGDRFALGDID